MHERRSEKQTKDKGRTDANSIEKRRERNENRGYTMKA